MRIVLFAVTIFLVTGISLFEARYAEEPHPFRAMLSGVVGLSPEPPGPSAAPVAPETAHPLASPPVPQAMSASGGSSDPLAMAIVKCTDHAGHVVFSNLPCEKSQSTSQLRLNRPTVLDFSRYRNPDNAAGAAPSAPSPPPTPAPVQPLVQDDRCASARRAWDAIQPYRQKQPQQYRHVYAEVCSACGGCPAQRYTL